MTRATIVAGAAFLFWLVFFYQLANDEFIWLTPDHYSVGVSIR